MATWNLYRMWRQQMLAVANSGCSQGWLGEWKATDITFRARSQAEAQKKANRFWRDAELGSGSMLCIPADEDTKSHIAEGK
jgi:hypothetical protein